MKNTTSEKKTSELYEVGQHIRVIPKRKGDLFGIFEGDIEALNMRTMVIKPDKRPHDGYRISIPWVDIKCGRYFLIREILSGNESIAPGEILM